VKGCTATVVRGIYVLDTAGPKPAPIAFITVKDANTVQLNWLQSNLGNFMRYHIYLDSTRYMYRQSVSSKKDTTLNFSFTTQALSNQRYCYSLKVEDTCAQQGKLAVSHCTILLRDTSNEKYHMTLKWLSYDGWGTELSHYELFRKDPGGAFTSIAIIDKDQLIYTDSWKCDQTYCYYVEAVHNNKLYRSRSNETCGKPLYGKPDGSALVTLVTVNNDSFPTVYWKSDYAWNPGASFLLERSGSGLPGSFQTVKQVKGLSASDNSADAHAAAYYYRVSYRDHCGLTDDAGLASNSIFLQGLAGSKTVKINWNQYGYWHSGVKAYKLQLKQRNGQYKDWVTLSGAQTAKDSINLESFGLDSICFRIVALKDTGTMDSSVSNSVCFVPASYVWVPSGFSPNQNGLNEVFKPTLGYVFGNHPNPALRYEFRIFNRWGQMIFNTGNPAQGWDGTFMNRECPGGLYIYEVKAIGYDGIPHQKRGTVYLIR
jgi:gliding motility-associated-like protein